MECEHKNFLSNSYVSKTLRDSFDCPWCPPRPKPKKTLAEELMELYDFHINSIRALCWNMIASKAREYILGGKEDVLTIIINNQRYDGVSSKLIAKAILDYLKKESQ